MTAESIIGWVVECFGIKKAFYIGRELYEHYGYKEYMKLQKAIPVIYLRRKVEPVCRRHTPDLCAGVRLRLGRAAFYLFCDLITS